MLIEKPARGDFLPILDGGYGLQYSPLMEYREGKGMVLFCQMDVTGRTESEPAADALVRNLLQLRRRRGNRRRDRKALYVGDAAGQEAPRSRRPVARRLLQGGVDGRIVLLIVGPGGGRKLAGDAAALGQWLKAGRPRPGDRAGQEGCRGAAPVSRLR